MRQGEQDTITAIATPAGEGAIAVIRVSGPGSFVLVDRIFQGKLPVTKVPTHTVHLGKIVSREGETVDQVLVTVFIGPHSYTGEDVVEVACHGGIFVTRRILECLLDSGARAANPGEFTKRAFLNGKLDLSQAEAVADLISSRSKKAHLSSVIHLQGRLGEKLGAIRQALIDLCSLLELQLDFSDEGVQLVSKSDLSSKIGSAVELISQLISSYRTGRIARDGFSVCLVGKPNVGKSSLFNSLLMYDRSIVTPIPGTTRDAIEENIVLDGFLFKITDTAGIRDTIDLVESHGLDRTNSSIERSDAICYVMDVTDSDSELFIRDKLSELPEKPSLVIHNKIDLIGVESKSENVLDVQHIYASASSLLGMDMVKSAFVNLLLSQADNSGDGVQITNIRHLDSLSRSKHSLAKALELSSSVIPSEIVAFEVRDAISAIGEITGDVTSDEIMNNIFSKFCIGK